MTGVKDVVYTPIRENQKIYQQLYKPYKQLHDGFGIAENNVSMADVMKDLLEIKERANS